MADSIRSVFGGSLGIDAAADTPTPTPEHQYESLINRMTDECSTEELQSYKRKLIEELGKRNRGESHEPTFTRPR